MDFPPSLARVGFYRVYLVYYEISLKFWTDIIMKWIDSIKGHSSETWPSLLELGGGGGYVVCNFFQITFRKGIVLVPHPIHDNSLTCFNMRFITAWEKWIVRKLLCLREPLETSAFTNEILPNAKVATIIQRNCNNSVLTSCWHVVFELLMHKSHFLHT